MISVRDTNHTNPEKLGLADRSKEAFGTVDLLKNLPPLNSLATFTSTTLTESGSLSTEVDIIALALLCNFALSGFWELF
jgi:hypothetical protein